MLLFGVMFSFRGRVGLAAIALLAISSLRAEMPNLAGTMPEDSLPGLRKLLDAASRQAPQLLLKELEMEQAAAGVTGARARLLPTLSANASYASSQSALSGNTNSQTRDSGLFYSFNFNQPLFYWGELKRGLDMAKLRETMVQRGFQDTRRLLFQTLRHQYLLLVAKKSALIHARATLEQGQRDLVSLRARLAEGLVSEAEVGARGLLVVERQLEFDRVEEDYARIRRFIGRLAGMGEIADADVAAEIPKPSLAIEPAGLLVAETLRAEGRNTFSAEIAELRVRETDLNYRNTKVRLLPKFGLGASQSLENTTNANANSVSQTGISRQSINVGASWTIWDSFATRAARLDALALRRTAARQLQSTGDLNIEEVLGQQKLFEFAARALEFADSRESTARVLFSRAQEDEALGTLSMIDVANANRALLSAQSTTAGARAQYYIEWSILVSLAGADPLNNVRSTPSHGR